MPYRRAIPLGRAGVGVAVHVAGWHLICAQLHAEPGSKYSYSAVFCPCCQHTYDTPPPPPHHPATTLTFPQPTCVLSPSHTLPRCRPLSLLPAAAHQVRSSGMSHSWSVTSAHAHTSLHRHTAHSTRVNSSGQAHVQSLPPNAYTWQ
jgi:hypothetical protein